jgi:hypothetical protein
LFCAGGQASGEELRGDRDLFVGVAVEGDPVPVSAEEYGVPGAPVFFWAEQDQLLPAIFAREDDLLFEITLHEFTSSTLSGFLFMTYYRVTRVYPERGR